MRTIIDETIARMPTPELQIEHMPAGYMEVAAEVQWRDTVLPGAGLDITKGDRYYNLHVNPIPPEKNILKVLAISMGITADVIDICEQIEVRHRGKAPAKFVVGVTYNSLARIARLANFNYVRLDESVLTKKRNAAAGWADCAARIREYYNEQTDAGRKNHPMNGFGLAYQTLPTFLETWAGKIAPRKQP